jgi:hypothetical protein
MYYKQGTNIHWLIVTVCGNNFVQVFIVCFYLNCRWEVTVFLLSFSNLISSLVFSGDMILFLVVICEPLGVILFFCILVIALSVLCPSNSVLWLPRWYLQTTILYRCLLFVFISIAVERWQFFCCLFLMYI